MGRLAAVIYGYTLGDYKTGIAKAMSFCVIVIRFLNGSFYRPKRLFWVC
jgi:hypothetical protein